MIIEEDVMSGSKSQSACALSRHQQFIGLETAHGSDVAGFDGVGLLPKRMVMEFTFPVSAPARSATISHQMPFGFCPLLTDARFTSGIYVPAKGAAPTLTGPLA